MQTSPVRRCLAIGLAVAITTLFSPAPVSASDAAPFQGRVVASDGVTPLPGVIVRLPGAEFGERNPQAVDAETLKTLMSISRNARASGDRPPLAVAELYDGRRAPVARRAYEGETEIVAADEIVSRLIAQSVRHRGLCDVYRELLTLNEGNAVFVRPFEGRPGTTFGELRGAFPKAVLLGTVRSGESVADPMPDPGALERH